MMNDRFSAQLRRHLVETADERPAPGLLEALDAQVATTSQRGPTWARLSTLSGRVGPFPMRTFRYGLVAVALIGAMLAAALYVGTPRPSTVFEGTWTSIDSGDGSVQSLVIGPGTTPTVRFTDHFASGAACVADTIKVFTADGHGTIADNRLEVVWPNGGGCGLTTVGVPGSPYVYKSATDTLVDGEQLTWVRDRVLVPPTRGPAPAGTPPSSLQVEPTPTVAPSDATSSCKQFDGEAAYATNIGTLPVSVTVPGTPAAPWRGERDEFFLSRSSCDPDAGALPFIVGSPIDQVYADACHWEDSSVEVATAAEAVSALASQTGHEAAAPIQTTLGPYPATRFDITIPSGTDVAACDSGTDGYAHLQFWGGMSTAPGITLQVNVMEVDGVTFALTAIYDPNEVTPADLAEIDQILATLRIGG